MELMNTAKPAMTRHSAEMINRSGFDLSRRSWGTRGVSHWCATIMMLGGLLGLHGCSKPEPDHQTPLVRPVKLQAVQQDDSAVIRQFPAMVEPTENARLTFRLTGKIIELPVRPGQMVKRGDLLARLDATDFELKVTQAKARFALANAQYERAASLISQKMVSQAMFDEAKAQRQVAEADLKTAESNLAYTRIQAPFSGTVARLLVEKHENVAAQQPILELQVRDQVDVVIQVPEDVIALVKKGTNYRPKVIFDSYPNQSYSAQIKEWDTRADSATNSFKVVFSMDTPKEFNVLSGMTANVMVDMSAITPDGQTKLSIPATALFAQAERRFVFVYEAMTDESGHTQTSTKMATAATPAAHGVVRQREVKVGSLHGEWVHIEQGVSAGEWVVTAGVQQLQDGQQVRPWTREKGL
jgi:RND family efflux transporter MFP subunit